MDENTDPTDPTEGFNPSDLKELEDAMRGIFYEGVGVPENVREHWAKLDDLLEAMGMDENLSFEDKMLFIQNAHDAICDVLHKMKVMMMQSLLDNSMNGDIGLGVILGPEGIQPVTGENLIEALRKILGLD